MGTGEGLPDAGWFEQIANGSATMFFILRVQPDLGFEFVNDAVHTLIGCTAAEALADAQAVLNQVDTEYADRLAEALALAPGNDTVVELTCHHRNGRPLHARTWFQSRQREDGSVVLEGTIRDVTQLRETEAILRQSEERYRLLAENAWDVVWTASVDGKVTYVSPAVKRLRGVTAEEAMHHSIDDIYPPESAASLQRYIRALVTAIRSGTERPTFRQEHEYYGPHGSTMIAEMQVIPHLDENGRIVELLGVSRDITERKALEAELRRLAVTDPVTGVWNRRHGEDLLRADLVQARGKGQSLSLLMLDVDHFKAINDTFGHQAGDVVLVEIARRLVEMCRGTDMVARWGGEEFLILLRDCDARDGVSIADKMRADIADYPFADIGTVSVSIGVAQINPREDLTSWVARADDALYEAKRSGRNTVRQS